MDALVEHRLWGWSCSAPPHCWDAQAGLGASWVEVGWPVLHSLLQWRSENPFIIPKQSLLPLGHPRAPGSMQNDMLRSGQPLLHVMSILILLGIFMGYDSTAPLTHRNRSSETGIHFSGIVVKYIQHTLHCLNCLGAVIISDEARKKSYFSLHKWQCQWNSMYQTQLQLHYYPAANMPIFLWFKHAMPTIKHISYRVLKALLIKWYK